MTEVATMEIEEEVEDMVKDITTRTEVVSTLT